MGKIKGGSCKVPPVPPSPSTSTLIRWRSSVNPFRPKPPLMAQLQLLLCSPSPSILSFSKTSTSLLLTHSSTLPSPNPSLSLSSNSPCLSLLPRRPRSSAVPVYSEAVESESEELSRTRLVAQNVPWTSTADDIRSLFQKHGSVVDIELSMHNKVKNRGLAFVEMGSPEEAIEALTHLEAYEFEGRALKMNYAKPRAKKPSPPIHLHRPLSYTLIVQNISFVATSTDLKDFFSSAGYRVISAEVVFQSSPNRSAGYGYVSFPTKREADAALSYYQGKELLGRPVEVKRNKKFVNLVREDNSESEGAASSSELNSDQVEDSKDS